MCFGSKAKRVEESPEPSLPSEKAQGKARKQESSCAGYGAIVRVRLDSHQDPGPSDLTYGAKYHYFDHKGRDAVRHGPKGGSWYQPGRSET
jgi:hypothetical protein